MKVTNMGAQVRDPDRVNISIDGTYRFSLTISQVVEHGVKVGLEVDEAKLAVLESASQFGKVYQRALEYVLARPHSANEVRDYLWRKTRSTKYRSRKTGEVKVREGISQIVADEVFARLLDRGYIDDEVFARWWVEHRNMRKGVSRRKLTAELYAKGVAQQTIDTVLATTERSEEDELAKMITKKRGKYADEQKLIQYLARQGFRFDDIKAALQDE